MNDVQCLSHTILFQMVDHRMMVSSSVEYTVRADPNLSSHRICLWLQTASLLFLFLSAVSGNRWQVPSFETIQGLTGCKGVQVVLKGGNRVAEGDP
jgi:hypothetical protein